MTPQKTRPTELLSFDELVELLNPITDLDLEKLHPQALEHLEYELDQLLPKLVKLRTDREHHIPPMA